MATHEKVGGVDTLTASIYLSSINQTQRRRVAMRLNYTDCLSHAFQTIWCYVSSNFSRRESTRSNNMVQKICI